jgi:hypothetical protein
MTGVEIFVLIGTALGVVAIILIGGITICAISQITEETKDIEDRAAKNRADYAHAMMALRERERQERLRHE